MILAEAPSGGVPRRDLERCGTLTSSVGGTPMPEGSADYLMFFGSAEETVDWLRDLPYANTWSRDGTSGVSVRYP